MKTYAHFASLILSGSLLIQSADNTDIRELHLDFNVGMKANTAKYVQKFVNNPSQVKALSLLEELYKKNNLRKILFAIRPLIPEIIHHINIENTLSNEKSNELLESWKYHHPDWQHIIWTDAKIKSLSLRNRALYDSTSDPVEKANIARYEILYQYGGVCVDMNTLCVRSLAPLHHMYSFYTGIAPLDSQEVLSTGLIAATQGNLILEECIKRMANKSNEKDRIQRHGAIYFSNVFLEVAGSVKQPIVAFPPSYFSLVYEDTQPEHIMPESFMLRYVPSKQDRLSVNKPQSKLKTYQEKVVPPKTTTPKPQDSSSGKKNKNQQPLKNTFRGSDDDDNDPVICDDDESDDDSQNCYRASKAKSRANNEKRRRVYNRHYNRYPRNNKNVKHYRKA